MPVILLIGEDERLLETRRAVLRTLGTEIVAAQAGDALTILSGKPCDLVVLCHTLSGATVKYLVAEFRGRWPAIHILRMVSLRSWDTSRDGGIEHIGSADPARLVKRCAELLGLPSGRSSPSSSSRA